MEDDFIDVDWEFVKERKTIKTHHIVNIIIVIIILLYLFGYISTQLIVAFIS
jgi:hypothetical protein